MESKQVLSWFTMTLAMIFFILAGVEVAVGAYFLALMSTTLGIANLFARKAVLQS